MVNKLIGKYNPYKTYKFAFMDIETNEWFLANKKPKDIIVKVGYFGSQWATHYQYRIVLYAFEYFQTKQSYTEYEFVYSMYKKFMRDMREQKVYMNEYPDNPRYAKNYYNSYKQYKFFKTRMNTIKNSSEFLIELLTK